MIYLSNFRTAGKDPRAISIAAITPRWYKGAVRKDLAPKLSTLTKYKKNEITEFEYITEYGKMIYKMDLERVASDLDGHVLLCYCSKNDMCHRLLLGLILFNEIGVEVEEIGGFSDTLLLAPFSEVGNPIVITPTAEQIAKYNLADLLENGQLIDKWKILKKQENLQFYEENVA